MAQATPEPLPRWIIDTDCGVDDAQALFVLLRARELKQLEIAAITCTHGNSTLDSVVGNVCAVLELFGVRSIPVFRGCDRALCAQGTKDGSVWHGEDGLGNTRFGASSPRDCVHASEHASCALLRLAREGHAAGAPLSLLTLGPLTNLALALRLGSAGGPALPGLLARIVCMGGAYQSCGNVSAAAEFNMCVRPAPQSPGAFRRPHLPRSPPRASPRALALAAWRTPRPPAPCSPRPGRPPRWTW